MGEPIKIEPRVLREVGDQHVEVAEHIAAARRAADDIGAAVSSYGPIMHEVKAAVAEILTEREAALRQHEHMHRGAADALHTSAAGFAEQEEINAERLKF
ncbi:type VII secretion target [Mycobacterium sp.]|jgi:hypothetical protein|uniref:type VII secretion target n=1 Tax=Mycobacterium sp. TaxID=1785 RepID=UPI002D66503B|nr:type VII secretion target [Mycobacterium sp.]HZA08996.1 type VII secretion target [Mycobacterium sp.]